MEDLQPLEVSIFNWFIDNYPELASELDKQLSCAVVTEREFTNGGGVFVSFGILSKFKNSVCNTESYFDGPLISSPELENGATVTMSVTDDGLVDHFEIFSLSSDYPLSSHIVNYRLSFPDTNVINLR